MRLLRVVFRTNAVLAITLFWTSASWAANSYIVPLVPNYQWTEGCSPTAGMMAMGYWDGLGFPNLIPGSNQWGTNQTAIQSAIASSGNIADYSQYGGVCDDSTKVVYRDLSEIGGAHADNSLADFMGTSQSALGVYRGQTQDDHISPGMVAYAAWRGYTFKSTTPPLPSSWDTFVAEINAGRPVLLSVDTDNDGKVDHSVTAIGYRTTNGYAEYLCNTTWASPATQWSRFRPVSTSYNWGVDAMHTLRPDGTWFTPASGAYDAVASWDSGLPMSDKYACIPLGGTASLAGTGAARVLNVLGTLNLSGSLTVAESLYNFGTITKSFGTLDVAQDFTLMSYRFGDIGTVATFTHGGGVVHVAGTLYLQGGSDSTGGIFYPGTFRQTAGDLLVDTQIKLGGIGRLEWQGGTITTPTVTVANGGQFVLCRNANLADLASGALTGGTFTTSNGGMVVVSGGATVTLDHGEVNVAVQAGDDATHTGTLLISGSASLSLAARTLGVQGGTITQTGGTVYANIGVDGPSARPGLYEMKGGAIGNISYVDNSLSLAQLGAAGIHQTGGDIIVRNFYISGNHEGARGTYQMDGGTLRVTTAEWLGINGTILQDTQACVFTQTGGTHTVRNPSGDNSSVYLEGTYRLQGGTYQGLTLQVGSFRSGTMIQTGGHNLWTGILLGGDQATTYANLFEVDGGEVVAGGLTLYGTGTSNTFLQTGGTVTITSSIGIGQFGGPPFIVPGTPVLRIAGGTFIFGGLSDLGSPGKLDLTSTQATIRCTGSMTLGPKLALAAVPGATIHMLGSKLDNQSTDPVAMAGLANLDLIFEGGAATLDQVEVACRDLGKTVTGLNNNFALRALFVGGSDVGRVQLVDAFDNQPSWTGPECLYLGTLTLGPNSYLDLNGINVYYKWLYVDPTATIDLHGGLLQQAPEPATLGLLALGLLGLAARLRRNRGD